MKFLIFLIPVAAWAQLQAPELGVMVDSGGTARPVFGVAGSVTTASPVAAKVLSAACSSELCLFKTRSSLLFAGGETKAPPGAALFALHGTSAFVYFPESGQLAAWEGGSLTAVPLNLTGEILSMLTLANGSLEFAVLQNGAITIVDQKNAVLGSVPGAGPVMLVGEGAVYAAGDSVVLRRSDATELRWPLGSVEGFSALGDGYVQVRAAGASYALRVVPGREQLFMLPERAR